MRYFVLIFGAVVIATVGFLGLRGQLHTWRPYEIFSDMDHQWKFKSQAPSDFFVDGRADRMPIPDTVPFRPRGGDLQLDYYYTGKMGNMWGDGLPVEVTPELLERGRERFNINCKVCHGPAGYGNGIVTQYGLAAVRNLQDVATRALPDGLIFNTITHGKGVMLGLPQIEVQDRWAIIAYVRALQKSQNATLADLTPEQVQELQTK